MGKGEDLNKRVWHLFEKAGFETKPNSQDPIEYEVKLPEGKVRPVDLYARSTQHGLTLLGSNKSRKRLKSFTAHIHDLENLARQENADAVLFVAAEKQILKQER